jgi:hypothetical protein
MLKILSVNVLMIIMVMTVLKENVLMIVAVMDSVTFRLEVVYVKVFIKLRKEFWTDKPDCSS